MPRLFEPAARRSLVLIASAPATARGREPAAGDAWSSRARITPHWFDQNNRFWYRNDLAGRSREFIAGRRRRRHARSRPSTSRSWRPRSPRQPAARPYPADKLPFDAIEFADDLKVGPLPGRRRDLEVRPRTPTNAAHANPDDAQSQAAQPASSRAKLRIRAADARPVARTDRRNGRAVGSFARRQVDGLRQGPQRLRSRRGETAEEIRLSNDGKEGLLLRPALVGARLEDARGLPDRARRTQGGLPDPVVAARRRPRQAANAALPAARRQVRGVRAQPLRRRAKKATKPKVDRIDFESPRLRWDKDGRHFTYEKIDRGHQRFRLIEVDSHTGDARNLIDEKSEHVHLDGPPRER